MSSNDCNLIGQQTQCKNETASAHSCNDEGKKNDQRDDRHWHSSCLIGQRHFYRDSGPAPRRDALSCQENTTEERQTEDILQYQAIIVANGDRKCADETRDETYHESRTKRTKGWQMFCRESDPLVPNLNGCSPMLQHEATL